MASAFGSELTCPICLELFDDPVTLPCMHSYCRKCLESILHSGGSRKVQCPECRDVSYLDKAGLQKLPRNFTLANIVAKYRNVDKAPQIPCDLCDEKMRQNAIKSCRDCKLSYCIQCLILHPLRGVFTTHSLMEPQEFMSLEKKSVCLTCKVHLENDSSLENCRRLHGDDVMSVETANLKLKSKLQGDYIVLEDRRRKYLQDIYKTNEALNDIMIKADATRADLKQKCHDKTKKINADFNKIQEDYDSRITEIEDNGQQHLQELKEASNDLHVILPDMKEILEKTEKDLDFEELQGLYSRVQKKVEEKVLPSCDLTPPDFDVAEKVEELYPDRSSDTNKAEDGAKVSEEYEDVVPTVTILSCTRNVRKKGEGASVTVTWIGYNLHRETEFELKFTEIADKDPSNVFIVRNISCSVYTVNHLQHNVTYSITVSVQGKPEFESEGKIVQTLPGVQCETFLFSSIQKSQNTRLDWKQKCLTSGCDDPENSNRLTTKLGVAAGTITLQSDSTYWEAEISFHLRGVQNNNYTVLVGICAEEKLDAVPNMTTNFFFYGLTLGKDIFGHPELTVVEESKTSEKFAMKGERSYKKRYGFFYSANQPHLVIIDAQKNIVLQKTKNLKLIRGHKCTYCPVFTVGNGNGDPNIYIVTGCDITSVPSCLQTFLE